LECPRSGPLRALLVVLREYLARRGSVILPTARAAGQGRLKMAFRGLYKSLPEDLGYARFWDIVKDLESDAEARSELERMGLRILSDGGEWYVEAPVELLEEIMRGRLCSQENP